MRDDVIRVIVKSLYETYASDTSAWKGVAAAEGATPEEIDEAFRRYQAIAAHTAPSAEPQAPIFVEPQEEVPASSQPKREVLGLGSGIPLADTLLWIGVALFLAGVLGMSAVNWSSMGALTRVIAVLLPNAVVAAIAVATSRPGSSYGYISVPVRAVAWLMLPLTFGVIIANGWTALAYESMLTLSFLLALPVYVHAALTKVQPRVIALCFAAVSALAGGISGIVHFLPDSSYDSIDSSLVLSGCLGILVATLVWLASRERIAQGEAAFSRAALILSSMLYAVSVPLTIYSLQTSSSNDGVFFACALASAIALVGIALGLYRDRENEIIETTALSQRILLIGAILSLMAGALAGLGSDAAPFYTLLYGVIGIGVIVAGVQLNIRLVMVGGIIISIVSLFPWISELLVGFSLVFGFFLAGAIAIGISAYVRNRHAKGAPVRHADYADVTPLISDMKLEALEKTGSIDSPRQPLSAGRVILVLIAIGIAVSAIRSMTYQVQYKHRQAEDKKKVAAIEKELTGLTWKAKGAPQAFDDGSITLTTTLNAPRSGNYGLSCTAYAKKGADSYETAGTVTKSIGTNSFAGSNTLDSGENEIVLTYRPQTSGASLSATKVFQCSVSSYYDSWNTYSVPNAEVVLSGQTSHITYSGSGYALKNNPKRTTYSGTEGYAPDFLFPVEVAGTVSAATSQASASFDWKHDSVSSPATVNTLMTVVKEGSYSFECTVFASAGGGLWTQQSRQVSRGMVTYGSETLSDGEEHVLKPGTYAVGVSASPPSSLGPDDYVGCRAYLRESGLSNTSIVSVSHPTREFRPSSSASGLWSMEYALALSTDTPSDPYPASFVFSTGHP